MSMTNSCSEANRIAVIYDWRVLSLRVTNLDSMFGADEWCLGRSGCVSTKDEHLNVGRRGSRSRRQLRQSQTAVAADDRGSCGRRSLTEEIVIMRDGVFAASSIEYRHRRTCYMTTSVKAKYAYNDTSSSLWLTPVEMQNERQSDHRDATVSVRRSS